MYRIATNTAYDWLKKQKKSLPSQELSEAIEFETIESNSSYYNIETINSLDLDRALKSLKPIQESVLRLYYQQGFTYTEISEILERPLNTIKTDLARAKAELLKKFNQN